MTQVIGFLPPLWGNWIEFSLATGSDPAPGGIQGANLQMRFLFSHSQINKLKNKKNMDTKMAK